MFASTMITQSQNILWVSKMLGHKDISITLKVYAKFIKENEDEELEISDGRFRSSTRCPKQNNYAGIWV